MRIIRNLIAALAVTLAVPSAAQAATITVSVGSPPAGNPTPFTFHVTGPPCNDAATDLTFTLLGGESKTLTLCDSPPDLAHRFHVTELVPAGWQLTAINCQSHDTDPADAFVVDLPSATAFVELSPTENKSCSFMNAARAPATPPTAASPPAASPPAASPPATSSSPPPASSVAGQQVNAPARPAARLRAQRSCASQTARVTVSGRLMRQVRFSVQGRHVRTVNVRRGARFVRALVPLRRSGPTRQRVRAQVTFRNGATPRTLTATVRRCASVAVAPQFTG
jgi:pyruvate/2-oxoglutarate dehydrogenase complex dihydrolipoamide acyltransferase (E2) component